MENFNALLTLSELKTLYSGKPVGICPLYKGVLGATKTFEATGNPIVLPEYKSLVKLTTQFSPKQAGTGDPSPDNVRPISGWDEVVVTRCGKNLFGGGEENIWIGQTGLQSAEGAYTTGLIPCKEGDVFTLSTSSQFAPAPGNIGCICFYNLENEVVSRVANTYDKIFTRSTPNGASYVRASCSRPDNDKIQFELGSTPTAYEPYQGTTATLTLPETIYGGTVDAVTGEGSKTWGFIELDGTENWGTYSNTLTQEPQYRASVRIDFPGITEGSKRFCTHFSTSDYKAWSDLKTNTFATDKHYIGFQIDYQTVEEFKSYLTAQKAAGTPVTVCYKLATPEPFKISQVSIPSLGGENNFFTNAENMDIIYKETSFWG